MNLLIDTNALIWWLDDDPRMGPQARAMLADPTNTPYVSAATAWEIAIKQGLGKLHLPPNPSSWLPDRLGQDGFRPLPVTVEHALWVERLPPHHRDPFDRLLIGQAQVEDLRIITSDPLFERYEVAVIRT